MAQTINGSNICIKKNDPIEITISTTGDIKAEIGETAKFMLKKNSNSADSAAVLTKNLTVVIANEIPIYVSSAETNLLATGTYYWSVKHQKSTDVYTIIPDSGCAYYPTLTVNEVLING